MTNPLASTKLFGLNNYLLDLIKLHDQEKFPKVIMLSGKKGLGKFTLVNHLMNYIFANLQGADTNACGGVPTPLPLP